LRQLGLSIETLINHAYPTADQLAKEDIATREFVKAIWNVKAR
jgi:hypothetical protein